MGCCMSSGNISQAFEIQTNWPLFCSYEIVVVLNHYWHKTNTLWFAWLDIRNDKLLASRFIALPYSSSLPHV